MTQKVVTTKGSKKAATIINESKRVYFFGVGGSEIVATDAYHKFCVPYRNFSQHGLPYSIDGSFFIDGKDCAVLISHTGQSKETIHIAETVRKTGAKQSLLLAKLILPLLNLAMSFLFLFLKKQNSDLKL